MVSDCFPTDPQHSHRFLIIFGLFRPILDSDFAVLGPKILANPISRGKNFGDVFFDLFRKSEQESEKIVTIDTFLTEIPDWWALLVHDCSTTMARRSMNRVVTLA